MEDKGSSRKEPEMFRCPICEMELLDRANQEVAQEDHDLYDASCPGVVRWVH